MTSDNEDSSQGNDSKNTTNNSIKDSRTRSIPTDFKAIKIPVIAIFGFTIPLLLMVSVFYIMLMTHNNISNQLQSQLVEPASSVESSLPNTANGYAYKTTVLVNELNSNIMVNKQLMKMVLVFLGLLVMSIGIMFTLLGIERKSRNNADINFGDVAIKLQISGPGLMVLIIGAAMSVTGGVLPNAYKTSNIPGYTRTASEFIEIVSGYKELGIGNGKLSEVVSSSSMNRVSVSSGGGTDAEDQSNASGDMCAEYSGKEYRECLKSLPGLGE